MDRATPEGGVATMMTCNYEQDLLLTLHGETSIWRRFRMKIHALGCESCRRRKNEFLLTSRALMSLRPAPAVAGGLAARPLGKRRLILCSAAVAMAAAAVSYYYSFGPPSAAPPSEGASAVEVGGDGHCAPEAAAATLERSRKVKSSPVAVKKSRPR